MLMGKFQQKTQKRLLA